jgi:ComF family protein
MVRLLDGLTRVAADLLFPPQCALCGVGGTLLCEACADGLPRADGSRCERCWMPVRDGAGVCGHCAAEPPAFNSVRAALVMDGAARRLVHELKYEGMTALAAPMAQLMGPCIDRTPQLVVPVPLHASRERSRGYNQAQALARPLAAAAGLPFDRDAVRRTRNTEPLAKTMHRDERRAIVAGAFAAREDRVAGRRVLLVDDVVTTGATLDACARALREAGAPEVRCVTWARAD